MRSIISIGGAGSCALPGPNSSPRAHFSRSSLLNEVGKLLMPSKSPQWFAVFFM